MRIVFVKLIWFFEIKNDDIKGYGYSDYGI